VREVDDLDSKIELPETPETLEDGGQVSDDELKELNLGPPEEPHPIYVNSLLTSEEEKEYFNILGECKDVFAWSYQEMTGLDPKIVVHHLSIKEVCHPKSIHNDVFTPSGYLKSKKTHRGGIHS